jgi:adenine C2-methylase RlmN of 23S rRNA A2503 and tRNA A37
MMAHSLQFLLIIAACRHISAHVVVRFCATGTLGIIGDLSSAEILEQFVFANRISKLRNVVFMGMGEPL